MISDDDEPMLRPGETCWRLEEAERAAFLIDSADYFSALKSAMLGARRSIWILAWTFDPLARLTPQRSPRSRNPEDADRLGLLLRRLSALKPALDVRILAWDMPAGIAASQLFAPQRSEAYFFGSQVHYRVDGSLPKSACHHQKVVVIDDRLAFVSGGDVGADRWDTQDHLHRNPHRRLPTGARYPARHEVSVMVEGAAVGALSELFVQRWKASGGETLTPSSPVHVAEDSVWPDHVEPDFWNHRVGIARTAPHWKEASEVHETLALHLASIAAARRTLYIENQYLTADVIVQALAMRLREPEGPEIIVVGPDNSPSPFDRLTMDAARHEAIRQLRKADLHGRFHAYSARTDKGSTVIVHSKVMVVDDRLVRVGSANLNNRSMGLDTEVDLAFEARSDTADIARSIQAFRNRLVGHYIGRTGREIEAAIVLFGGLPAAIDALDNPDARRLAPVELIRPTWFQKIVLRWKLGDPISPQDTWRPWRRRRRIAIQLHALRNARTAAEMVRAAGDPAPPPAADDPTPPSPAQRTESRST
jgi:phosphatidylserine/phosphatidylglycerophosphate/cardiolipin synthase-like enzyme